MNINQTRSSSYGCLGVQANSMSLHAITFIIGAISFFNFEFIGEVYPAEIALVLMIPLLWKSKYSLLRDVEVKKILFFGLLWLVSQIITDLIRSTPTNTFVFNFYYLRLR